MFTQFAEKYQSALCLQDSSTRFPSEAEVQALWFESFFKSTLKTDLETSITVVHPGIWNRAEGPDFLNAAFSGLSDQTLCGSVEIHLRAQDWTNHGHHLDGRYESTLLHGVWFRPTQTFFPSTLSFRRIPQTILSEHLIAPWSELSAALDPLPRQSRPLAQPGLCQRELSEASLPRVLEILRTAGAWRIRRKAERLRWRFLTRGRLQGVWESLAESLGYAQNKLPMRLLAQRVPICWPELKPPLRRAAFLYGIAGFLPDQSLTPYAPETRNRLLPLWDHWWKERDRLAYALLPREIWNLSCLRPSNRPERRIAALSHLYPHLATLSRCLLEADARQFSRVLASIQDPFWSRHSTWRSAPSPQAHHLLGQERIDDILLNIFWPLVSLDNESLAYSAITQLTSTPNRQTRIARERILGSVSIGRAIREALIQQGLLQLYQDFCLTDDSACQHCPFPDLVKKF